MGEVLEPFAFPHTVAGCMRGSHHAPLMAVAQGDAHPSRFDGPPRVVCLGFQVTAGRLIGPRDLFDDPAFDRSRQQANEVMDYLRRHGPFEPHGSSNSAARSGSERSLIASTAFFMAATASLAMGSDCPE